MPENLNTGDHKTDTAYNPTQATQEEVMSHSAVLTNIRLSRRLELMADTKVEAWFRPTPDNLLRYYAESYALFDDVFMLLPYAYLKKVVEWYAEFWVGLTDRELNVNDRVKMWQLVSLLDKVNRQVKAGMQMTKYFFRTQVAAPRMMKDVLKVLDEGGGFFGGKESKEGKERRKAEADKNAATSAPA